MCSTMSMHSHRVNIMKEGHVDIPILQLLFDICQLFLGKQRLSLSSTCEILKNGFLTVRKYIFS
jgi:hypothetical protein